MFFGLQADTGMRRCLGMRLFKKVCSLGLGLLLAGGSLLSGASEEEQDALMEVARDREADFNSALSEARDAGMSEDWLLEAEIVRALVTSDLGSMLDMVPRIEAVGSDFRYGLDRDFQSAMQLEGFADTLKCAKAYREDRMEEFERFAVSSFAKAPQFNKAFGIGDLLAGYRMQQVQEAAMKDFKVPMDLKLANVEGETMSLGDWMGDNDAMLMDFWASWCGPCIRLMPKLKDKEASLSSQGVFVAAVNTDQSDQLNNANKIRDREGMDSVPWLLDRNGGDLSTMLMIDSIPRMVLVDRTGKVLYNGHPMDPALDDALAKIGVSLSH